ncbi:hypothetical protein JZ751_025374 [Albula glossodonta]|uniref:Uncharacterized protein n=1 Tax=Albula glossodonta TaxID=121402 RepID=A0A8T2NG47_9TELE|nr:hypothetical protein JZ751_025374 [Albula glossodonta]
MLQSREAAHEKSSTEEGSALAQVWPAHEKVTADFVLQSGKLESETGTTEEHSLNKEARKWATRVAREHKNIIHNQRWASDITTNLHQT